MAQLNDLLVMGQSTLLGPVTLTDTLYLTKVQDADPLSDKRSALIIGNLSGEHLAIDGNEIVAKTGTTTSSTLHLNIGTGTGWVKITDHCTVHPNEEVKSGTAAAMRNSLIIHGPTYGNKETDGSNCKYTKEQGKLSYGDPGPQIIFGLNDTITSAQKAALIFTDHDHVAEGTSLSLVTTEAHVTFITDQIKAYGQITAQSFNATSDARLKENFQYLIPQKSILDLPIYKFDFINGSKNQIGCKAQDLQEICPEIVNEDNNGYLSIQESKIVYLLIDEIKQLKNEVNKLKSKEII